MPDVADRIRSIVAAVMRVPSETVAETSSSDTIGGWNSLNHIQLVLALEEEFGVQFAVDDMEAMQSVGAIVAIVGKYSE